MLNKILAATLAATLAFTAPASAKDISQEDALGALMFGLITGLIINEMDKDDKSNRSDSTSRRHGHAGSVTPDDPRSSSQYQRYDDNHRYDDRGGRYENPTSRRGYQPSERQLPRLCTKRVHTMDGTFWITADDCLNDMNVRAELPRACRIRIDGMRHQVHTGYSPSCLERYGYNIGR
jgi:hypothetical protein